MTKNADAIPNNRLVWKMISRTYAEIPHDRKVLLKRKELIYCGIINLREFPVRINWWVDGYSQIIPRVADFWCEIPLQMYEQYRT